ncbi:MAG TPA: hypothetical protein VM491_04055 [Burkholderiaceae bacterium]|jgi:hypothetical protein|nr:hypothetical protein [Burkholderiaceae bacterium]
MIRSRNRRFTARRRSDSPLDGLELELADDLGTLRFTLAADYLTAVRRPPELDSVTIEIADAAGTIRLTRQEAAIAGARDYLPLDAPVAISCLSGAPGYRYRTHEVDLALSRDELHRLLRQDLTPAEFHALFGRLGGFREIAPALYDRTSGAALQPVRPAAATAGPTRLMRCLERALAPVFPLFAALSAASPLRSAPSR